MSKTKQKSDDTDSVGVSHTLRVTVPDTWEVVPLETVLEDIVGGGTPSRDNPSYWDGSIPWLTVKDMRTRRPEDSIDHISDQAVRDSATNIIPADTVIIATRIGLGKVIRVPYDAAINQDLKALITKPAVDKSYLEYWIYSIANYLESIGSGTTVKGIRLEHVRSLPFPLAPLDQQKRIVAEIEKQFSRLDEAVANLKRVKANLKRYKAAVLKAAVEGRLVETEAELARREGRNYETGAQLLQRILETRRSQWKGKGKYKEPAAPDTTDLPELPEGWACVPVDTVCDIVDGDRGREYPKKADFKEAGYCLFLSTTNVRPDGFLFEEVQFIDKNKHERLRKGKLDRGDIVFTSRGTIGNIAYYGDDVPYECVRINSGMFILRGFRDLLNEKYLEWYLRSPAIRRQIDRLKSGTAQPQLPIREFRTFKVTFPGKTEQMEIVNEIERRYSVLESLEGALRIGEKRAERLRQSVLSRAFSGGLCDEIVRPFKIAQG